MRLIGVTLIRSMTPALSSAIRLKPEKVELVLTGRNAHERVIEAADLVTEMTLVKHHFAAGVKAQEGIEF